MKEINESILKLQSELYNYKDYLTPFITSVILDGSYIRGDFLKSASDIDITVTWRGMQNNSSVKKKLEDIIKEAEVILPKRKYPQKPLIYDIQWQYMNEVEDIKQRKIEEWNLSNIPCGYPKLWIYAFDSIQNHYVLFGEDVTLYYTQIPPEKFVPLRLQRLRKSVDKLGIYVSEYDKLNGTITQMKNAWEILRCELIQTGQKNISKENVLSFGERKYGDTEFKEIISSMRAFYFDNVVMEDINRFREQLYYFSTCILKKNGV